MRHRGQRDADQGTGDTAAPPATEQTTAPTETGTASETDTASEDMDDMDHSDEAAGDPFSALKMAADHVGEQGSAKALATGIAQAAGLTGDVEAPANQAYAALSTVLQEHVYLAGIAVDTGLSFGLDSPEFEAAAATLDENSVELSELVGSVSTPEDEQAFLELWRQHIGFFVDYAAAKAEGDQAAAEEAQANLDQYQQDAGAFFESITGGTIPQDAVVQSLEGHIETLSNAIDALAVAVPMGQ